VGELRTEQFEAMGSPCRIVVAGGPAGLVDDARRLVEHLERAWSRFRPSSEISQLNRSGGRPVIVSAETFELIQRAEQARALTAGRFNPLMLTQLEQLGYAYPWQQGPAVAPTPEPPPQPGSLDEVELIPEVRAVRLPEGTAFDPGGLGKGLAADRATELLVAGGATTVLVELGGDLRVHGASWYGPRWRVEVAHPHHDDREIAHFHPEQGAVTTSSTLRRNWSAGQHPHRYHHLLDARTGLPSSTDVVAVTTCAGAAWWSEVAAKSALLAGSGEAVDLLEGFGVAGIVVTTGGTVLQTGLAPAVGARAVEALA
jgi:thiamine biosynthesis lipoprotein